MGRVVNMPNELFCDRVWNIVREKTFVVCIEELSAEYRGYPVALYREKKTLVKKEEFLDTAKIAIHDF